MAALRHKLGRPVQPFQRGQINCQDTVYFCLYSDSKMMFLSIPDRSGGSYWGWPRAACAAQPHRPLTCLKAQYGEFYSDDCLDQVAYWQTENGGCVVTAKVKEERAPQRYPQDVQWLELRSSESARDFVRRAGKVDYAVVELLTVGQVYDRVRPPPPPAVSVVAVEASELIDDLRRNKLYLQAGTTSIVHLPRATARAMIGLAKTNSWPCEPDDKGQDERSNCMNFSSLQQRARMGEKESQTKLDAFHVYWQRPELDDARDIVLERYRFEPDQPDLVEWFRQHVPSTQLQVFTTRKTAERYAQEHPRHSYLFPDFANRHVGGGVMRHGFTQEEMLFCELPEALCAMELAQPLGRGEALHMYHLAQHTILDVAPDKSVTIETLDRPVLRNVLVYDSLNYSARGGHDPWSVDNLHTDLYKILAAFHVPACKDYVLLGGNWGAGVFRPPDRVMPFSWWLETRWLLQVLGAAANGQELLVLTFFDVKYQASWVRLVEVLERYPDRLYLVWRQLVRWMEGGSSRTLSPLDYILDSQRS